MTNLLDRLQMASDGYVEVMNSLEPIEKDSLEHKLYQRAFQQWQIINAEIHKLKVGESESHRFTLTGLNEGVPVYSQIEEDPKQDALDSFNQEPLKPIEDRS